MKWVKKGLIYNANEHQLDWAKDSALTPTPILLNSDVIRIYFGARDTQGISRIRFIDVSANNPAEILQISQKPSLDIGRAGAFDDNGVILGDVVKVNDQYYMFYVGFQLVQQVKFLAFTGLAISNDNGVTFTRATQAPILDRSDEGLYIRAIHSAIFENGIWRIWYAAGNDWLTIKKKPYPCYHINYTESANPLSFPTKGRQCVQVEGDEYRIGRPRVYKNQQHYRMYYTKGSSDGSYLPGFAHSNDGLIWKRQDNLIGIETSKTGWDAIHLCYPSLLTVSPNRTFMFYNGNFMGKDGFGYAEYISS